MTVAPEGAMTTASSSYSPRSDSAGLPVLQSVETRMVLITGADRTSMEEVASAIFDAGHVPVIGDWFTDPLLGQLGLGADDEASFEQILQPMAERLLARCDA